MLDSFPMVNKYIEQVPTMLEHGLNAVYWSRAIFLIILLVAFP